MLPLRIFFWQQLLQTADQMSDQGVTDSQFIIVLNKTKQPNSLVEKQTGKQKGKQTGIDDKTDGKTDG
jgi:hypothetical protein